MRGRLIVVVLLAVTFAVGLFFVRSVYLDRNLPRKAFEQQVLHVLTYSTFVGVTGPGPEILDQFKAEHNVDVEVVTAEDAGLLLQRLKLTESIHPFDVVIGLDQLQIAKAKRGFHWRPVGPKGENFLAFDWSPMTFIYRKSETTPPREFADLLNARYAEQFALQDPHESSPGLQFLNWVKTVEGDKTEDFLNRFKPNVQSVSPSWALSYGLFKRKRAKFVFSYVTSLAFHWNVEHDHDYQAVSLKEGHPIQIEYVGVPASCQSCALGEAFAKELLTPAHQKLIMEKNYMLPVVKGVEKGTIFAELPELKTIPTGAGTSFREWDDVFKR